MENENTENTSPSKIIFLFLILSVGLFILCAAKKGAPEELSSSIYVCCLFFIPFIPFIFSILYGSNIPKLHSSIAFFSALSIIFYLFCWYAYKNKWSAEYLWLMPLCFSFILSGFTILITWLIFEKNQQHPFPSIIFDIEKIKNYPFLTLCLFLVLFISITYLFGFSFAFNDKYLRSLGYNQKGLYINPESKINSNNKNIDNIHIEIPASKKITFDKIKEIFERTDEKQRNTFITHIFNDDILTDNNKEIHYRTLLNAGIAKF